MSQVILLSLTASINPTLVAATTVMLLLPSPKKLMLGYLLGAYTTSITLGLVIVFSIPNSSATNTTENTISPAVDIGLGAIALAVAFVLYTGRAERLRRRGQARKADKPDKGPPRWQRELSKGSPKTTFVIGALLSLPGASYLAGLHEIHKLFNHHNGGAGNWLQPCDDVAARSPPGVIPGRSRLDTARDRASQTTARSVKQQRRASLRPMIT
jgi:Sap, sulfolipid-1-addressing protein